MRKQWTVGFVALTFLLCAVQSGAQTPAEGELEKWRAAVAAEYESLSAMSLRDRKAALGTMTARMQEAVWTLHMRHVLATHPELTADQRSVLYEAMGLLADGGIERHHATPDGKAAVDLALTTLMDRARSLLPAHMVRLAFFEIGKPEAIVIAPRLPGRRVQARDNFNPCECSTLYGCDPFCESNPLECTPTQTGCGPMAMEGCNGLCIR